MHKTLAFPIKGAAAVLAASFGVAAHAASAAKPADAALIQSAMSAAPQEVSRNATVIAMGANGSMRTLKQGSNGWTCMPDDPKTPAPDPMCLDENGMAWAQAWMTHAVPPAGKVGLAYMLAGAADASNTDPFADKPATGQSWVITGPHIMILNAAVASSSGYPGGAKPDTTRPYVMFGGTPYAHIMLPVKR
ncbi:hypothetical protein ABDK56_10095 [Sphingomonas sp. ASV193]|uniref:hypothetical protein n=1 Tax=Sphingomonas sp. ASV193 TaxID=3144405 RepID=UPI0032E8A099